MTTATARGLAQVTSFTIAHTVTLALSIYGVFSLPPSIVVGSSTAVTTLARSSGSP